jgi:hypothetical protein
MFAQFIGPCEGDFNQLFPALTDGGSRVTRAAVDALLILLLSFVN